MAGVVTIPAGTRTKPASWRSIETLTASTSTTPQAISIELDVTILGGSTVTAGGAVRNLYTLADGFPGQEKMIQHATATGASHVIFDYPSGRTGTTVPWLTDFMAGTGTASAFGNTMTSGTGQFVMQADGDFLLLRFVGSDWQVIAAAGATMDTTT